MRIILHIWRQRNAGEKGRMARYEAPNVSEHMSFLEMLDVLNEDLIAKGDPTIQKLAATARSEGEARGRTEGRA